MHFHHSLDLTFRGNRDYLHGTDVYTSLVNLYPNEAGSSAISLSFHSQIFTQIDFVGAAPGFNMEEPDHAAFRGRACIGTGSSAIHGLFMESNRPVTTRRPCNERSVIAKAIINTEKRCARLQPEEEADAIDQVVFLNKQLHLISLPASKTAWLFARLELKRSLPAAGSGSFEVQLTQVLGGRFTRSDIRFNEEFLGNIYFAQAL